MATRLTAPTSGSRWTALAFAGLLLVSALAILPAGQAAAPSIGTVSPPNGSTNGGELITVTGNNFEDGALVELGTSSDLSDVPAEPRFRATDVQVTSGTTLTARVPAHAPGGVSIRITNPGGESTTFSGLFTYVSPDEAIVVDQITPDSGSATGGTQVSITGENFDPDSAFPFVTFDGVPATVLGVTATAITVLTPAHDSGTAAEVEVTFPGAAVDDPDLFTDVCDDCFSFDTIQAPTVTGINVDTGSASGGREVTITGTRFVPGMQVVFASVPPGDDDTLELADLNDPDHHATRVVYSSATQLFATSPSAMDDDIRYVRVIHPAAIGPTGLVVDLDTGDAGLEFVSSNVETFVYSAAQDPTLVSVLPVRGPQTGGFLVTLTGTKLHGGANEKPTFTLVEATGGANNCGAGDDLANQPGDDDVNILSASSALVRMPENDVGTIDILVQNPADLGATPTAAEVLAVSACLEDAFEYVTLVEITGLSKTQGPAAGGTADGSTGQGVLTIMGNGFDPADTQVFFGNHRALVCTGTNLPRAGCVAPLGTTEVTVVPPPQATGSVYVAVLIGDGRAATFFPYTYVSSPAPGLSHVEGLATSNGGEELDVIGSGFQFSGDPDGDGPLEGRKPEVKVGGLPALVVTEDGDGGTFGVRTSFTILAPMKANVPAAGEKLALEIKNPDGRVTTSDDQSASTGGTPPSRIDYADYDKAAKPEIGAVSDGGAAPPNGPTYGGTVITISGAPGAACGQLDFECQLDPPAGTPSNFFVPESSEDERKPTVTIGGTEVPADHILPIAEGDPGCPAGTGNCIRLTVPAKVGSGAAAANQKIKVTNPDGQNDESDATDNADDFDYDPASAPRATGFGTDGETSGSTNGGTYVVITGDRFGPVTKDAANVGCSSGATANAPLTVGGFDGTDLITQLPSVTFDGAQARVLCVQDTGGSAGGEAIHVLTPPGTSGPASVAVTNPDGQTSAMSATFSYTAVAGPSFDSSDYPETKLVAIGGTLLNLPAAGVAPVTRDAEGRRCNDPGYDDEAIVTPLPEVQMGGVDMIDICVLALSDGDSNDGNDVFPDFDGLVARTTYSPPAAFPSPGDKELRVENPNGLGANLGGSGKFRVLPFVAVVRDIAPASATVNGGSAATITGTAFPTDPKPTILVDGIPAAGVGTTTSSSSVFVLPAGLDDDVLNVQAVDQDGQSGTLDRGLTVTDANPPQLRSVTPALGSVNGGSIVTVEGAGFAGGATVLFGGKELNTAVSPDGKRLTFVSPNFMELAPGERHLGPVDLVVFNPVSWDDGDTMCVLPAAAESENHCLDLSNRFSYSTAVTHTVGGVDPSSGPAAGGTAVTIAGTNFASGAQVRFGLALASDVQVVNSNTITAKTPAGAGIVAVSVTSGGQTISLANAFTYIGDQSSSSSTTTTTTGTTTTTSGTRTTTSGTTTNGGGDLPTPADILEANQEIELRVTRVGNTNVLEWDLPPASQRPALPLAGVQVHFSNSPYTLLDTFPEGSDEFEAATFTHTGAAAQATTKYLVTMYYGTTAALGFFSGGSAPDTADYPGQASTDEQPDLDDGDGGLPTWAIVLIVLGILFLVVLVAVLIARGRQGNEPRQQAQTQQTYAGWDEPKPAEPATGGEVHQARCPACATSFTVTGTKPVITVCPGCGKKGILR